MANIARQTVNTHHHKKVISHVLQNSIQKQKQKLLSNCEIRKQYKQ